MSFSVRGELTLGERDFFLSVLFGVSNTSMQTQKQAQPLDITCKSIWETDHRSQFTNAGNIHLYKRINHLSFNSRPPDELVDCQIAFYSQQLHEFLTISNEKPQRAEQILRGKMLIT